MYQVQLIMVSLVSLQFCGINWNWSSCPILKFIDMIQGVSHHYFSVVDATLVGITLPWPGQRYKKHIDSCYDHAQA